VRVTMHKIQRSASIVDGTS